MPAAMRQPALLRYVWFLFVIGKAAVPFSAKPLSVTRMLAAIYRFRFPCVDLRLQALLNLDLRFQALLKYDMDLH